MCRLICTMACVAAFSGQASAAPILVPAATEGNAENCVPLTCERGAPDYQQIYDSDFFSHAVLITSVAFRPDSVFGGVFTSTFSNVQILLGTTLIEPEPSGFGLIAGSGMTTVFSGPLTISSANTGTVPKDFDVLIKLMTPFLYDPSSGNLLFEFHNLGTASFSGRTFLDAANETNDGVSRRRGAEGDSVGLVTKFNVPEPVSLSLVSIGLAGLGVRCLRQRRSRRALSFRRGTLPWG